MPQGKLRGGLKGMFLSRVPELPVGVKKLADLAEYDPSEYDAIVFPGGFGGAKNLSDFAVRGPDAEVNDSVSNAARSTHAMGKPIGFICIIPASVEL